VCDGVMMTISLPAFDLADVAEAPTAATPTATTSATIKVIRLASMRFIRKNSFHDRNGRVRVA
jgi:hypothetical protein